MRIYQPDEAAFRPVPPEDAHVKPFAAFRRRRVPPPSRVIGQDSRNSLLNSCLIYDA
jgi:hypothetical protein